MIIVETPLASIKAEIERLEMIGAKGGPNTRVYAKGALDALQWLMSGTPLPSDRGIDERGISG